MSDKMSAPTRELLLHIAERTWCSADDLRAALPHQHRTQMLKRLGNLVAMNWLERYDEAGKTYWSVLVGPRNKISKLHQIANSAETPAEAPAIVPPRRVNVMHGPTYQPAPAFTARPGALDALTPAQPRRALLTLPITTKAITMTTQDTTIPHGYWRDAQGNLVPESKVKDIDKLRTDLVTRLCQMAEAQAAGLKEFKLSAMAEVAAFVAISLEQYGVKTGGTKGNVTLTTFDGKYKLVRQMADNIVFGEQLMAAKELIDECVHEWAAGANDNIRALVSHAFQTDKEGKINTGRVLGLRRLAIRDEKWQQAMQAIADSMQTASSKPYVRFYVRDDKTLEYRPIVLDAAAA